MAFVSSFTVTLFLPYANSDYCFNNLTTPEMVTEYFNKEYPDAVALMPNLVEEFFNNPTGPLGTIKCSPWSSYGKTLLLGDAAHAIVPFYGQGMNASFEDVVVFDEVLEQQKSTAQKTDWAQVFQVYENTRKKDTDAIADLAVDNFHEMKEHTASALFQKKRKLETALEAQFPQEYFSKYSLVTFNEAISYSEALKKGRAQDKAILNLIDDKKITQLGHKYNCLVGFDLAHGAGNIQPNLHDTGADFAVWCTYKYLNSGPGSLGGCFVHERHAHDDKINRFAGWWGHNKETRFNMRHDFEALPGAEGWQLSNPPILSMAAIRASLDVFKEAGFDNLRSKSKKLTGYLEFLIDGLNNERIRIITPRNKEERGCQLSIQVKNADKKLHERLTQAGVISDWREPDVIRVAPAPLYNNFTDVYEFVQRLKKVLEK